MQRMKATVWRRKAFPDGAAPCQRTINKEIAEGKLPGEKIGSLHYIHVYDGTIEPCWSATEKKLSAAEVAANTLLEGYLNDAQTA